MRRILFVCGNYYPMPYANGICVLRLQEILKDKGIDSDIICTSDEVNKQVSSFGYIYFVNKPIIRNNVLRKIVRFCIWPINDFRIIKEYKKTILRAKKENEYDCVIGVLRPIEGVLACALCGDYLIYECDSISNNGDNLYGIKRFLKHRVFAIERYIYHKAGFIFHLNCHKDYYEKRRDYKKYLNKSCFVDIPHFSRIKNDETTIEENCKDKYVHITYLGSLSQKRNPPDYSIILFNEVARKNHIRCEFYSRGCDDALERAKKENESVFYPMGYVSQDALIEVKKNTDFFLSIGFNYSGTVTSIPSKIFEYMSTGKPIIHISGGVNDTAIPYLKEYGNALIVDPRHQRSENVINVEDFIKSHNCKKVELETLRNIFPMNTPEYTVDLLLNYIEKGRMR